MNPLKRLYGEGQSVWLDYIRRTLITSGDLNRLIEEDGVRGTTSNPTIFEKAITGSADYDESIRGALERDPHGEITDLYETLVIEDIQMAADVLRPIYDETRGIDGYVSLEVSPHLSDDTQGTITEARRLWDALDRPNIMIKVPATKAGVSALEALIAGGVNVNATLMFSLKHYEAVANAYIRGLERCENPERTASVASFFVSRVDAAVDAALESVGKPEALALRGKIAVSNAKLTYKRFGEIFGGVTFSELAARGARVQRPLWASTSTKNPEYSDVLYVDELIGPDTVNTLPPATLNAFRDHGQVACTLMQGVEEAEAHITALGSFGIDFDAITDKLQVDGVAAFSKSFDDLLEALKKKRSTTLSRRLIHQNASLGEYETAIRTRLQGWEENGFASRLNKKDSTLWSHASESEISDRLGWLSLPKDMHGSLSEIDRSVGEIRKDGFRHAVLLGMGGSSLASEVFKGIFGTRKGYLELFVLDSTHPDAVRAVENCIDLTRTLFVVSSKSGTTLETLSLFKYFWDRVQNLGVAPGRRFIGITDPETPLEHLAGEREFRRVFRAPTEVGGRFSALSVFGLVPAALIGVDIHRILDGSWAMVDSSVARTSGEDNPALALGAFLGELAVAGRDKLTILTSAGFRSLPAWIEQLVAESTGKDGKGILPVVDEPIGGPELYGTDRSFVQISLKGDTPEYDGLLSSLEHAEHPVCRIQVADRHFVGQEFFRWEVAVVAAGSVLGIHPFNQPDVQLAKQLAKEAMAGAGGPVRMGWNDGVETTPVDRPDQIARTIESWLSSRSAGDYIALHAYLPPSEKAAGALQEIRRVLRDRSGLATTAGFGPRFLHSTGQLHKGGRNNGLFVQIVDDPFDPLPVPETDFSFGELIHAQALGDAKALVQRGRRVIRVDLGRNGNGGLEAFLGAIRS